MRDRLITQVGECLSTAELALQKPDQIQIFEEQVVTGPEDARLRLHAKIAAGMPEEFSFLNETNRWIYLYVNGEHGPHTSFDMGSLASEDLRGITDRSYDLPELAASFSSASQDMAASIVNCMYRYIQGDLLVATELRAGFTELMETGSSETIKHRTVTLEDDSEVGLMSKTREGIFTKPDPKFESMPKLGLAITSRGLDGAYVLEDRDGFPECFVKTVGHFEKLAAVLDESQVVRDDAGNVSMITGNTRDAERIVIEMERVAGLRDVRPEVLNEIYPRALELLKYIRKND